MPYKDPERKRQWEREHREERNAARRKQPLPPGSRQYAVPKAAPEPISDQKSQGTWKTILGWAIGIGVVLLAIGGVNPNLSSPRPS